MRSVTALEAVPMKSSHRSEKSTKKPVAIQSIIKKKDNKNSIGFSGDPDDKKRGLVYVI